MDYTSIVSHFTSNYIFPAYHILKRDGLRSLMKEYERSQWYSYDRLRKIQKSKLKRLLIHCQHNVPYYNKLFKHYGLTAEDLCDYSNFMKLPYLSKKIINQNKNSLISLNVKKSDLISNSTSGSTGENLYFYHDKKSMLPRQAVVFRNQKWVDCLYTDRKAFLWGAPFDIRKSQTLMGKLHAFFTRDITLSSYELSEEFMKHYLTVLRRHKPRLLVSYPTPLATFAEFLIANNETLPSIKSIITSAETLYSWQRSIIEKAFECPVYDRYGSREFGNIAHECDKHEGYHVNMERFFLEVLNDRGETAQDGEAGEIFVTDFDSWAFPFVRYKIDDMAVPSNKMCSCGRGLTLLERVEGRTFDIITAPNGNRVAGTFWTLTLRSFPGIKNFQVEQTSIRKLIIRIVSGHEYASNSEEKIISQIKDKCGNEMEIEIVYIDHIPLTKSGKRKFVFSHLLKGS